MKLSIAEGELKIVMGKEPTYDKFTLKEAGLKENHYTAEGGKLRLKIELGYIQDAHFFKMPIIELNYENNIDTSEWVVDFNGENILESKDNSGHKTVLLLNRNKMMKFVHRHENNLIIHGDFSQEVHIKNDSTLHILDKNGH